MWCYGGWWCKGRKDIEREEFDDVGAVGDVLDILF